MSEYNFDKMSKAELQKVRAKLDEESIIHYDEWERLSNLVGEIDEKLKQINTEAMTTELTNSVHSITKENALYCYLFKDTKTTPTMCLAAISGEMVSDMS